jgi:hypothetical protein
MRGASSKCFKEWSREDDLARFHSSQSSVDLSLSGGLQLRNVLQSLSFCGEQAPPHLLVDAARMRYLIRRETQG